MLIVYRPVANYNTIIITVSRLFLSYIKTSFQFLINKNYNVRKVVLTADISIIDRLAISMSVINIPIISKLVVYILVVNILVIDLSIVKTFLSYIFLVIFVFLIMKILMQE